MSKKFNPERPTKEQISEITAELHAAADTLSSIGPAVSLFGSARLEPGSPYYVKSMAIAAALAQAGFAVIAGGGPGIMEAANKGAYEAGGQSVGLNIKLPREATDNVYQTCSLHFHHFSSRKSTFFMHSEGYVVLPGGFGTLDELFEALTLMQTRKLPPAPVILVGGEFWNGLVDWLRAHPLAQGTIGPADMKLFTVEDDTNRIVEQLLDFHRRHSQFALRPPQIQ